MTFALDAETTGGWCLPEAQLAIAGIQVARAIYDYLAVPNDKNEYVPDLADKITPNADFTSWTIHVRSGIKFHDGTPLDAQGRQGQPRRLPRQVPRPFAAAVHLRVRRTSRTSRSPTR